MGLTSLKAKFLVVTVLVYLVIGLVTLGAFYTGTDRIIHELALRFVTKEALLEKNRILSVIDREVVLARKMADDITLKRWAEHEDLPQYRGPALEELESYRRLYRDKSFFIALAASRHYYTSDRKNGGGGIDMVPLDPAKPDDSWFFQGLKQIDGCALNLDYNSTLHETKVWFNAVMTGTRPEERIGICGGGITITRFLDEIVSAREKGLSTILIDRTGVIKAHEDHAIVEHNATARDPKKEITIYGLMKDPATRERLRAAIADLEARKDEVRAFPARLGGQEYLAAVSFMPGVGWFNVVLVDVSRVISMKAFLPIVGIMFLSLLMVVVTMGYLMNRMVLVPLTRLSRASLQVAAGQYNVTIPVTGNDEVGQLTGTFNTMTATIQDYTNNLETKVRQRTEELSTANRMLEESQHAIMESLAYARSIQTAMLPERETMDRCLGEHFVLYQPKEMVGGDFYYLREFPGHVLLAVIDCTGHGVPGAFMTMTVNSVLNHVVNVVCNDNPSRILSELNRVLRQTLKFREVDAGLDIALCLVDRPGGRLLFAGAGLSCFTVSGGVVRETRGNHQRVGYRGSKLDYRYDNHELTLLPGDTCYLTTDGLLDEAGGEKGFGFGIPRFKTMLAEHAHLGLCSQAGMFQQTLDRYRGERPRRDDLTLVGFRW